MIMTDSFGLAEYTWQLNGKIGDQTVLFKTLFTDISNDSVVAHATGNFYTNAWQISDCLPNATVTDICQSASGRLFCGFNIYEQPYYSDNNGISWQKISSFPVAKEIRQITAQGNEIYVGTRNDGIYYSPDNGVTWENRSTGITDVREVFKLEIKKSGKLFLSTYFKALFISVDKGLHWTEITSGVDYGDHMHGFSETSTGVLYMISDDKELFKSTNGGASWFKTFPSVSPYVQSIFIDSNDDIYIASTTYSADIFKSTDGGNTWMLMHIFPLRPGIALVFKDFYKVNQDYYLSIDGYGVFTTRDFLNYRFITSRFAQEYWVASNHALFIPGAFGEIWYNLTP
jgi:photosystem II stability/assembly factor-like uncharacterized protein